MKHLVGILNCILAVQAIWIFFRAPLFVLWYLRILFIEWGYVFSFVLCASSVLYLFLSRWQWSWWVLGWMGAVIVFLLPLTQNGAMSGKLWPLGRLRKVEFTTHSFTSTQGHLLTFDLYRTQEVEAPLVVMIHGGSWKRGTRADLPELNYDLVERGYHVAAVSYRLAPQAHFPAPKDDVLEITRFILSDGRNLKVKPSHLFFIGRSAGGHLATVSAMDAVAQGMKVDGVVAFYAPLDLVWGYQSTRPWDVLPGDEIISGLMGIPLEGHEKNYEAASPVHLLETYRLPPTLLIHGPSDELVSIYHSRSFQEKAKQHHYHVDLIEPRYATHGFDYAYFGPGALSVRSKLFGFLENCRSHLGF